MNLFVLFGHPPLMMDAVSATICDGGIQRYHAVGGANGTTMVVMFVG